MHLAFGFARLFLSSPQPAATNRQPMPAVLNIVAPVFGLIALGYFAGRFGWIATGATKGLADFTFMLAIPAMLFRSMATAHFPGGALFSIWGAFFGAALIVWILSTVCTALLLRRPGRDAPAIAMSAAFGNVVMLGIPLSIATFGPDAAATTAILVSLHSPLLLLAASLHMTWAGRSGNATVLSMLGGLGRELATNSIVLAIAAGTLWRLSGLDLNPLFLKLVSLLGQAAIPCALTSLGLSLVGFEIKGQTATLSSILILKLLMMPAAAALLAIHVLALPPIPAGVVIIFAAMPTGANAYLFASRHQSAMNSASGAVALGTILSAPTASAVVYILNTS